MMQESAPDKQTTSCFFFLLFLQPSKAGDRMVNILTVVTLIGRRCIMSVD